MASITSTGGNNLIASVKSSYLIFVLKNKFTENRMKTRIPSRCEVFSGSVLTRKVRVQKPDSKEQSCCNEWRSVSVGSSHLLNTAESERSETVCHTRSAKNYLTTILKVLVVSDESIHDFVGIIM